MILNIALRIMVTACCIIGVILGIAVTPSFAAINVVTSTPELADIVKKIGGSKVSVYSVAQPNQDYHMIEPRPSNLARISRAKLVVRVGMDLDGWMDALLNAAGKSSVNRGGAGYVDTSSGVPRLEIPSEKVTGASGDIHVYGNPHYLYDPQNAKIVARNIMGGLERVSPVNKAVFRSNYESFSNEVDRRTAQWQRELKPYRDRSVVTYHKTAVYFQRRFGIKDFGQLEPKPGIPPSASHIQGLMRRIKEQKGVGMVIESVYPKRFPDLITRETGVEYVVVPYSVGAMGTKSYFDLIDRWVNGYKNALR